MIPEGFHFLRPAWLLALLLLVPWLGLAWRRRDRSGWERVCEPHLLRHLLSDAGGRRTRFALAAFAIGWLGACLALAGPTWQRLPQPAFADPSRTVFVLGLAPSMNGRDVAPSRMARARHKLEDALDRTAGGSVALVVYREEAFAATPLTDDLEVMRELVPLLETNLAPGRRVLPARGIEQAERLLEPVGLHGADILLLTDGADDDPDATLAAAADAARRGARVSVLGIAGDPTGSLEALARAGGGAFAALSADDRDLARLERADAPSFGASLSKSERQSDDWRDVGVWLVWIPLLLAPLAFRRGWATAALLLLCLQLPTGPAQASVLDWFQRPDQRGADAFSEERYADSAASFEDPAWRAAALYRAGDFASAAELLKDRTDPESSYNRGNALARAGRLQEALQAYDASLAQRPEDADARFNRDLVQRLLEQQQQQQQQQQDQASDSGSSQSQSQSDAQSEAQSEAQSGGTSEQDSASAQESGQESASEPDSGEGSESQQAQAGREAGQSSEQAGSEAGESSEQAGTDVAEQPAPSPPAAEERSSQAQGSGAGEASTQASTGPAASGDVAGSPEDAADASGATPSASSAANLTPEQQDAARWMARLPDDPGGLLREKIRRDYQRKTLARQQGEKP